MSLKELRDELRNLRKESVKPVSRMKKADIASELQKLRGMREEAPPVSATPSLKPKKQEAKVANIKEAKEKEFPVKPAEESKKKSSKKSAVVGGSGAVGVETKMSKKDMLKKMIEDMSDSE